MGVSNLPGNPDTLLKSHYFADISLFTRKGTKVYSSVDTPEKSLKGVIYNDLNRKIPKYILVNKIDEIINLAKKNGHQLPGPLNWRKELEIPIVFSMQGVKRIDAEIKAQHQDQAKEKTRPITLIGKY